MPLTPRLSPGTMEAEDAEIDMELGLLITLKDTHVETDPL
jgi:hypothetical protein